MANDGASNGSVHRHLSKTNYDN
jgi:hypothetical protein